MLEIFKAGHVSYDAHAHIGTHKDVDLDIWKARLIGLRYALHIVIYYYEFLAHVSRHAFHSSLGVIACVAVFLP